MQVTRLRMVCYISLQLMSSSNILTNVNAACTSYIVQFWIEVLDECGQRAGSESSLRFPAEFKGGAARSETYWEFQHRPIPWMVWTGRWAIYCASRWSWIHAKSGSHKAAPGRIYTSSNLSNCSEVYVIVWIEIGKHPETMYCYPKREGNRWSRIWQ